MRELNVDVFSDVVCPWCLIGTRRLHSALAALPDVKATLRHHAFMLDPGTPVNGINLLEHLREKYGRDPGEMFSVVEDAARESGITLDLRRQPFFYNTARAHTLIRHAASKGTQAEVVDALFTAYFLQARNISVVDVLQDIGTRHGFTAEEVGALMVDEAEAQRTQDEAREASEMGIRGVPFFVFNGRLALSGAQPEATFRAAAEQAVRTHPLPAARAS